jgi:hypothetical protein
MPTIIKLNLRHDTYVYDPTPDGEGAEPRLVLGYAENVDLDALTPRARAMAEAIAQCSGAQPLDIWVEYKEPIMDHMPDWRDWFTEEQAAQPDRRPWRCWSRFPATSPMTAVEWLEREARKIPPGWHVLGAHPRTPVPSLEAGAADQYLTRDQVLAYMRHRGVDISIGTWGGYTSRGQAPRPDRYVARTPQWCPRTIDTYLAGRIDQQKSAG